MRWKSCLPDGLAINFVTDERMVEKNCEFLGYKIVRVQMRGFRVLFIDDGIVLFSTLSLNDQIPPF